MSTTTTHVLSRALLSRLEERLSTADAVCFDIETRSDAARGGLEDWWPHSRIVTAAFCFAEEPDHGWALPLSHPDGPWSGQWKQVAARVAAALSPTARLVGHNLPFDVRWWVRHTGYTRWINRMWWDTQGAAYLLDENRSHRLKRLAQDMLGVEPWGDEVDLSDAEQEDLFRLGIYNALDVIHTLVLVAPQRRGLSAEPQFARLFRKLFIPALRIFTAMQVRGIAVDREAMGDHREAELARLDDAEQQLLALGRQWGVNGTNPSFAPTSHWFINFMDQAVQQGGLPVMETTGTGRPSWRKGVLNRLASEHEVARELLTLRQSTKRLEYLTSWQDKEHAGRLYPSFHLFRTDRGGTSTGRTSSSHPNLQQVTPALRPMFTAPAGWLFVEVDYSQIELRLMAEIAQVSPVLDALHEGVDLHTRLAAILTGLPEEQVESHDRQIAKSAQFGLLYRMSLNGFITYASDNFGLEFDADEAARIKAGFFSFWKGLSEWHAAQAKRVRRDGYVDNLLGRRRRLPDALSSDHGAAAHAERQAINFPVQSLASDLLLLSAARVHALPEVRLLGAVHDSLLMLIPRDYGNLLDRVAASMVENILEPFDLRLSVPLAVEAKIGRHWNDDQGEVIRYG